MNYKPLFIDKLSEYTDRLPNYTIGEVLFSIFTQLNKAGVDTSTRQAILNITDQQIYSAIDKAIKEESE
jgi:hypothetical protein